MDFSGKYFDNLGLCFNDIAEQNKSNTVLRYVGYSMTYNELNVLANKIADFLKKMGIIRKDVVGIFSSKEPLGYASMLACIKIGAIYTNIDKGNPNERLKKFFQTAQPRIILADHSLPSEIENAIDELSMPFYYLSDELLNAYNDDNPSVTKHLTGSNPVYIMFTSGSTGVPKGVLISNSNMLSFISWSINGYNITNKDIFAQVSPLYFDNSVFDFYTALFAGASLAPIKMETVQNPVKLVQVIDDLACTIFFSVPSLFLYLNTVKVLTKDVLKSVRIFTFGGEGYPIKELKKLFDIYAYRARLINVYGPTEGSCICSSYELSETDFSDSENLPPLGKINKNFEYLILDKDEKQVKAGTIGELCLLGPNVALGYYNNQEQTQASFIKNPLRPHYREIMYKTGDLVREDKDHILWFAGRKDNQIKHMGYRIELEEIENAINSISFIHQSAVIYKRIRINYGKLIAYVSSTKDVEEAEIKKLLSDLLPSYMIPNIIRVLDCLPKNSNGKTDRVLLSKKEDY